MQMEFYLPKPFFVNFRITYKSDLVTFYLNILNFLIFMKNYYVKMYLLNSRLWFPNTHIMIKGFSSHIYYHSHSPAPTIIPILFNLQSWSLFGKVALLLMPCYCRVMPFSWKVPRTRSVYWSIPQ